MSSWVPFLLATNACLLILYLADGKPIEFTPVGFVCFIVFTEMLKQTVFSLLEKYKESQA